MKKILLIFLLTAYNIVNLQAQIPAPTIPDFTFYRMDKIPFTEKDLPKNKKIFIVFFDTQCDHCQRAIKTIGDQYKYFKNAALYLVSIDNQERITTFMDSYGQKVKAQKNILILQDLQNQFITKFKPKKYPSMFLYSAKKTLILYEDDPDAIFKFLKPLANK